MAAISRYLLALLCTLSAATQVLAEGDDTVSARLDENFYMAGGNVTLAQPVPGDFSAAAGKISVEDSVGGDANLAAGKILVQREIAQDLRAAGGDVLIANKIGGNALCVGGNVEFTQLAETWGPARLAAGTATLGGKFHRDVVVYAREIKVNAELVGDTRLTGESITLGPNAKILGKLSYASPTEIRRDPGAQVIGTIERLSNETNWHPRSYGHYAWWVLHPVFSIGVFILGVLWLLLFPRFSSEANHALQQSPGKSIAAGIALAAGVPWLAVLFFITVVGIPVGVLIVTTYPLLLMIGYLATVCFLGDRALSALGRHEPSSVQRVAALALALLALALARVVPFAGWLITVAAVLFGTGAVALALYRRYAKPGGQQPAGSADLPPHVSGTPA